METNELNIEFLSIIGLNPWVGNDSSSRQYMFSSHIGQRLIIKSATERRVQTGMEIELAKYTFSIKMPTDGRIIKVIEKYPQTLGNDNISFNPETYVIYEDVHTKRIEYIDIPTYKSFHPYFGYRLVGKDAINQIYQGNVLNKGTILADSPAVSDLGGYKYGVELNLALMSHPAGSEDGIMISTDAIKKLAFNIYETRVIEFGEFKYLLNIYGDKDNYKCFPDIGEYVRSDGLIAVMRDYDKEIAPAQMSYKDTMKIDHMFDECVYVNGNKGKVINIKIIYNKNSNNTLPEGMDQNLNKYVVATRNFYKEMLDLERSIFKDRKNKFGIDKLNISPAFHRLLVESNAMVNDGGDRAATMINKTYRKSPMDIYRVELTIEYEITPTIGFKLTGCHGDKGVICEIREPHEMPMDKDGVRAEVVMDDGSTVSRMNIGRLYEQFMGSSCLKLQSLIKEIFGIEKNKKYSRETIEGIIVDSPNYSLARERLLTFYGMVLDKMFIHFDKLTQDEMMEHLANVIENGVYLYSPPDNQKDLTDVVEKIHNEFNPTYDVVTMIDDFGKTIVTENKVRIAPVYMMLLEKIADTWSAVSSGNLQHFGVLSPTTKAEKYAYPFKNSAVRTVGETEGRLHSAYGGRMAVAEIMDRNNNPLAHRSVVWNIMNAPKPGYIENAVDRSVVEFGGAKPLQLLNHITICSGWKFKYTEEEI